MDEVMNKKRITAADIVKMCEVMDIPSYGTVMSYEEFMSHVTAGCIMDYDGDGEIILFDKLVKNSYVSIYNRSAHVTYGVNMTLEKLYELFGDNMKICWYNK